MAKGYLRMMILALSSLKEQSGYSIMKEIREKTGCWKPSTGSVYPLLGSLTDAGMLKKMRQGRKTLYSITQKGRQELKEIFGDKEEFRRRITEKLYIMKMISEDRQVKEILGGAIAKLERIK